MNITANYKDLLSIPKNQILLAGLLLTLISFGAMAFIPASSWRLVVVVVLLCFLPGWALVEGLFAGSKNAPVLAERLLLGLGIGYAVTIVGGLWLYYLFGRLTLPLILGLFIALLIIGFGRVFVCGVGSASSNSAKIQIDAIDGWWLLGLLAFAAYFRFYFLSYSDYRGDEAEVVLRAIATIRGQGEAILTHTKGPAETLLTTGLGLLYGTFEELAVRVPFALANCLAVAATYLLGKDMFGRRVAIIATALVVINGWFVTYSRTAQYQNLVLPAEILAVWCFWRFYQNKTSRYLFPGAILLALATFGHYEGAAAGPAALYLLVLGLRSKENWRNNLLWPILAILVGAIIVFSFYIPFFFNATINHTQNYLSGRLGGTPPYNNWDAFYVNAHFYNSLYYIGAVGGVLLLGTLLGIWRAWGGGRRGLLAAAIALPLLLLSWTNILPAWYALVIFLLLMGLYLFSPRIKVAVKANLLWMIVPFALYLFGVIRPGNHYYVFVPPLILLAALTLDWLWQKIAQGPVRRWLLPAAAGSFLIIYGLSTWYIIIVFMRPDLEYMLTYPEHRRPVFVSDPRFPFDIRIGWGFPYRLGWQTISELYRSDQLSGDWYSNDENNSIFWYTLGSPRNPCFPHYYMLTDLGYKEPLLPVRQDIIDQYYTLRATVEVNHRPRLELYEFTPEGSDIQSVVYNEPADYPTLYREELFLGNPMEGPIVEPQTMLEPARSFKPHPEMLAQLSEVYNDPNTVYFPDRVSLQGYDLDTSKAQPGGYIVVTLYWHADAPVFLPYKVFVHLGDEPVLVQADDEPACGHSPTYNWQPGEEIMDRHILFLPDDLPPGEYPINIGLYEVRSGLRMDLLDELDNPADVSLTLTKVSISSPE